MRAREGARRDQTDSLSFSVWRSRLGARRRAMVMQRWSYRVIAESPRGAAARSLAPNSTQSGRYMRAREGARRDETDSLSFSVWRSRLGARRRAMVMQRWSYRVIA